MYTVEVSIPPHTLSLLSAIQKGSLLSSSDSIVNFMEGLTEFNWSDQKKISLPFLTMQ